MVLTLTYCTEPLPKQLPCPLRKPARWIHLQVSASFSDFIVISLELPFSFLLPLTAAASLRYDSADATELDPDPSYYY